jgi:hypothetical protein
VADISDPVEVKVCGTGYNQGRSRKEKGKRHEGHVEQDKLTYTKSILLKNSSPTVVFFDDLTATRAVMAFFDASTAFYLFGNCY